jgi:hypothetical protein
MPDRPPGRRAGRGQRAGPANEPDAADAAALDLLSKGTIEVEGRLVVASNATLYCTVRRAGREAACVYKPVAGERPLWDFASGSLAGREVAAYRVSAAGGFAVVPPTVFRDGPFGPGMCQLWIHADESVDVIALARRTDHPALRDMAVFDAVVNNADRKIGHLLPEIAAGAAGNGTAPAGRTPIRQPRRQETVGETGTVRPVRVGTPRPARSHDANRDAHSAHPVHLRRLRRHQGQARHRTTHPRHRTVESNHSPRAFRIASGGPYRTCRRALPERPQRRLRQIPADPAARLWLS